MASINTLVYPAGVSFPAFNRHRRIIGVSLPPDANSGGQLFCDCPSHRSGWRARPLVREIENFPAPVIAMVEGSVWGGATETVFACDFVIATETATFAVTPAKLGVPYNVGGMLTLLNATGRSLSSSPRRSPRMPR